MLGQVLVFAEAILLVMVVSLVLQGWKLWFTCNPCRVQTDLHGSPSPVTPLLLWTRGKKKPHTQVSDPSHTSEAL